MKKTFLYIIFCAFTLGASAQTLSPAVLSPLGSSYLVGGNSISGTMGQTYSTTLQSSNNYLSQGFEQPELSLAPTAYAVTGGANCGSTTVGVANSQTGDTYKLYLNSISPLSSYIAGPINGTTGNAINFGAQTVAGTYYVVGADVNGNTTEMTGSAIVYANPTPTASPGTGAGGLGSYCTYQTVSLSSAPSGLTYLWSNTATTQNQTLAASGNGGTYSVTVTDGHGCTGSASATVTVNTPATTVVTPTTNTICALASAGLTASGSSTYVWSPSTNLNASTGSGVIVTPTASGTYTYTVTGTDGNGCTASATTVLTALPLPIVTVNPGSAVCTGTTTSPLVASGAVSYTWAPATDLDVTTGNTVTAQISLLTFYTVTGTGANSCTANSATVPVATIPVGGTVLPVSSVICSGGTQTLTASGVAGHDYQWQESVNNVYWTNISGATNTTYTTASADGATKKYYRIVANSNACWDIASTTAIVDISITPTVSFTAVTSTSATVTWMPFGSGQYSISWMGAAGTGSASALTTNTYTITGLSPNASLLVTVTPTVTCSGSAQPSSASTNTLCAVPGSVTVTAAAAPAKAFKVTWAAVNGATAYVVYYRNLLTSSYWSTVDTSGTQKTVVVPYAGATYAVYVAAYGCPASGDIGDGSAVSYVTTNPLPEACISIPDVTATSGCPNQITVGITGGSGSYELTLRRLSPSLTAGVTYAISGSTVNITVGTQFAGTVWEVFARNVCSAGNNSAISGISIVTVKPGCPTINNLVLSHVSCSGFIASWNTDNCAGEGITAYQLLIKQSNELNYDGYSFSNLTDYAGVDWLNQSRTYNVEIRSIACNGATSALSAADTITTTSCNTREEQAGENVTLKSTGNTEEAVAVYPNPAGDYFFVDIGRLDMTEATVKIELVNELGQAVQTSISTISGGHLNQLVSTPAGLSSGIYFVRTTVGSNTYVSKLMITKE